DPEDKSLRKVEKEVLIPKLIRDRVRQEHCAEYANGNIDCRFAICNTFEKCGKDHGLLLTFKCRQENRAMVECMTKWYRDENLIKECTEEYLRMRSEYRRTGIGQKTKRKEREMI
ncbi:COX assembly mitochondrial protein-like protein, partial [Dinothrombium tinctorium]